MACPLGTIPVETCSLGAVCSLSGVSLGTVCSLSGLSQHSHSALGISTGAGPNHEVVQAFLDAHLTSDVQNVLSALRHLILTEAHRIENPMWIALDAALQRATGVKCKWGGVQLVLEGDFLQLTQGTPLFAQADFHCSFKVIYLTQQWRSRGGLQELLGVLAMKTKSSAFDVRAALQHLERPLPLALRATAVHLFGRNKECKEFNEKQNDELSGAPVTYKCTDIHGRWDTRSRSDAKAALDTSTNLLSDPLHLKVRCSTASPVPQCVPASCSSACPLPTPRAATRALACCLSRGHVLRSVP